jgi:hypothetical protein
MFFKTADEQLLQKLLAADTAERRKLAKLKADLEALRPQWLAIQTKLEGLCASYANNDRSYARTVYEEFWRSREAALPIEIDELVKQRDALTSELPPQIAALKAKIHHRHSISTGDFGSWALTVASRLPQPLAVELMEARTDVAKLTDLGEIFERIGQWVEKVGKFDEGPALPPLLNVAGIVRKLAA